MQTSPAILSLHDPAGLVDHVSVRSQYRIGRQAWVIAS